MDLWALGLRAHANLALNRYLDDRDETDGLPLVPFFMATRAAVRAHVTATQAMGATSGASRLVREARTYFDLAAVLLDVRPARLVARRRPFGTGEIDRGGVGRAPRRTAAGRPRRRERPHTKAHVRRVASDETAGGGLPAGGLY